jgi:hypothetical protein
MFEGSWNKDDVVLKGTLRGPRNYSVTEVSSCVCLGAVTEEKNKSETRQKKKEAKKKHF